MTTALTEWKEAYDAHIRAYGRPPSFSGPLDDYHRELARKWLAAVDEVGVTYGVGKLSDTLNRFTTAVTQAEAELRALYEQAGHLDAGDIGDEDDGDMGVSND